MSDASPGAYAARLAWWIGGQSPPPEGPTADDAVHAWYKLMSGLFGFLVGAAPGELRSIRADSWLRRPSALTTKHR